MLDAGVSDEPVTEGGGRRFMAAWRKEEENAARLRQEKREKQKRLEDFIINRQYERIQTLPVSTPSRGNASKKPLQHLGALAIY